MRDSAALLDATHGVEPGDPYVAPPPRRRFVDEVGADPGTLRIGVLDGGIFHDDISSECRTAVRRATALVADLGHRVEPLRLAVDRGSTVDAFLTLGARCSPSSTSSPGPCSL